ncbi:MAG: quinone-dependent dihydroorotate dehydrogenase [Solirubrobacterales bacterium]|nr:quinone-dependent dihydroorotate dehydrogenase [Solirubrobacterales bacterium]
MIYRTLFDRLLARLEAERVHRLASRVTRAAMAIPGLRAAVDRLLRPRDGALRVSAMGLDLRSPLGLAGGVDKDATWFKGLGALGFGFLEVGTVTALPQKGNEEARRRLSRLPADRALLNQMGFPNPGARAFAERLRRRPRVPAVGVNVGKTRIVPLDDAVADYRESVRMLAPVADFVVLNVSSPNTPELTQLQAVDRLGALIDAVREEIEKAPGPVPLLIKIGPDLSDAEIGAIAGLALSRGLDGMVAVNTTVDLSVAANSGEEIEAAGHAGGISGRPLKARALEVLVLLRAQVGDALTLVSVGGVETPQDAWDRILAGATLVQAYTPFVYEGPLWPHRMNSGLSRLLAESPWPTIEDAVGRGPARPR